MDPLFDELIDEVQVVLECVLGLLGVSDIARVTDGCLDDTAGPFRRIDTKPHLWRDMSSTWKERDAVAYVFNVVQRIEDPEDIQTVLDSLFREIVDGVITVEYLDLREATRASYARVTCIANAIGTAN